MIILRANLKHIVAAAIALVMYSIPAAAQDDVLRPFHDRLKTVGPTDAKLVEREIRMRWTQSGSPAVDLLFERGKKALERGDAAIAVEHFTAAVDHAPDFAEAFHGRARAYVALDQFGPALADLEQVLRLNPDHFDALFGLGVLLEQMGKPALAYETYALVLALHPHYEDAQAARARLLVRVEGRQL